MREQKLLPENWDLLVGSAYFLSFYCESTLPLGMQDHVSLVAGWYLYLLMGLQMSIKSQVQYPVSPFLFSDIILVSQYTILVLDALTICMKLFLFFHNKINCYSAGVRRTGAFIVIDSMLDRLKHEKTVDVYGHVTCLRAQRNYMMQTEDQFIFILSGR